MDSYRVNSYNTSDVLKIKCSNLSCENYTNVRTTSRSSGDTDVELPLYIFAYLTVINAVIFLIGVFGNTLVILVVCKVRTMRNPTNYFLFTLSIADLCVLLVCQPVAIMEFYAKERWYLGEIMCKMIPMLENGLVHVSVLTMIGVTTERFYSIIYPLKNMAFCADRFTIKFIGVIWLIGHASSIPFAFITRLEDATFFDGSEVKVCRTKSDKGLYKIYILVDIVAFFVLPFVVLTYMYLRIIRRLISDTLSNNVRQNKNASVVLHGRKQIVRTLILIIVLFFVSMCTIRSVILWQIYASPATIRDMGIETYYNIMWLARILMYTNHAVNPVIYTISSTKFKLAFRKVLRTWRICSTLPGSHETSFKYSVPLTRVRKLSPRSQNNSYKSNE